MALKPCPECGKEISSSAKVCPSCGKRIPISPIIRIAVIVITILAVFFIGKEIERQQQLEHEKEIRRIESGR
jgi:endogenous inhibitor of DNA gyrase (YacG/DUF329 family)